MNDIHIKNFGILDNIREKYGVTYREWAAASGLPASRLSELRRNLTSFYLGEPGGKAERAFSPDKCSKLVFGLREILGDSVVQKELERKLKLAEDLGEELFILFAMLPDDRREDVRDLLKDIILGGKPPEAP